MFIGDVFSYSIYYYLGLAISSPFWGIIIDKYGRKYPLIFSLALVSGLTYIFGNTFTYGYAIIIRFLLGLFNGISIIGKTISTEICPESFKATSIALTRASSGLGLSLGSFIGNYFLDNKNHYNSFTKSSITITWFGIIMTILVMIFFEETLNNPDVDTELSDLNQGFQSLEDGENFGEASTRSKTFEEMSQIGQLKSLFKIPNMIKLNILFVINSMSVYFLMNLAQTWSGRRFGYGDIFSRILHSYAFSLLWIVQVLFYLCFQKFLGDFRLLKAGHFILILLLIIFSGVQWISYEISDDSMIFIIGAWTFIQNVVIFQTLSSIQRFSNDLVRSDKRGRINGIQTVIESTLSLALMYSYGPFLNWLFNYQFLLVLLPLAMFWLATFVTYRLQFTSQEKKRLIGKA